jgi:hypothetical protein
MDEMLAYFAGGPGVLDAATQAYMRHVVGKMGKHQQAMNSALHHPLQMINNTEALQIRDEVMPLLRYLIEK